MALWGELANISFCTVHRQVNFHAPLAKIIPMHKTDGKYQHNEGKQCFVALLDRRKMNDNDNSSNFHSVFSRPPIYMGQ